MPCSFALFQGAKAPCSLLNLRFTTVALGRAKFPLYLASLPLPHPPSCPSPVQLSHPIAPCLRRDCSPPPGKTAGTVRPCAAHHWRQPPQSFTLSSSLQDDHRRRPSTLSADPWREPVAGDGLGDAAHLHGGAG